MTVWDRDEARELVALRYGKTQAELAYQSMNSTIDRQEYARYHYRNAKSLFETCVGKFDSPVNRLKISTGGNEDARDEFNQCIWEIGAHVTACVQSLHAMGDIFAHAIYYALGYKLKQPPPLLERKICLYAVRRELNRTPEHQNLAQELNLLASGDDFAYLGALSNHSKHRSLVRSWLWVDLTDKKLDTYTLEFQEFIYDERPYSRRLVLPFLQSEFDRQSLRIFEIGNVLNSVLKGDSSREQS